MFIIIVKSHSCRKSYCRFSISGTSQVPLVLQQLCAALTKIPVAKLQANVTDDKSAKTNSLPPTNVVDNKSSTLQVPPKNSTFSLPQKESQSSTKCHSKCIKTSDDTQDVKFILGKRRKSLQTNNESDMSSNRANSQSLMTSAKFRKRRNTDAQMENNAKNFKIVSNGQLSLSTSKHQGKITEYLPEMKDSNGRTLRKEKLDKASTTSILDAIPPSLKPSLEEIVTTPIKTELTLQPNTPQSTMDLEEEGVLIIDDKEDSSFSQQRVANNNDENQENNNSNIVKHESFDDTKQGMTENDLKFDTENAANDEIISTKSAVTKYSRCDNAKHSFDNISSFASASSVSGQLPLDMLIKDDDVKAMPMSPLPCSSSSGISSTSSSSSVKDDSSSVISLSRMSSSSSGASSYTKDYDHLFEMPRAVRFPPPNSNTGGIGGNLNKNKNGMSLTRISRSDSTENANNNNNFTETVICRWELCGQEFDSNGKLLDHLKMVHARIDYTNASNNNNLCEEALGEKDPNSQSTSSVQYKCLWEGCKVYGKGSSTKSWLEKHVIANHGGNKPFACIVDDCKERFGTQSLLERHVNSHFKCKANVASASGDSNLLNNNLSSCINSSSSISASNFQLTNKISKNSSSSSSLNGQNRLYQSRLSRASKKLMAPNGKKLKYRKTIYSARIFDLFDLGVMAQVRQRITAFESGCKKLRYEGCVGTTESVSKNNGNKHKKKKEKEPTTDRSCSSSSTHTTSCGVLDETIVFRSEILAKRTDPDGQVRVLLKWIPNGM